ncbi:MAG: PEP-utilizing enzyme [Candidatus Sericytochromatia bacterium]
MTDAIADIDPLFGPGQTKADVLAWLSRRLPAGTVLPMYVLEACHWSEATEQVLDQILTLPWGQQELIVRSSAADEDQHFSKAGHYLSLKQIRHQQLAGAINQVIARYEVGAGHKVLIQPMLLDVKLSGVIFTHEPSTGAPYYVFNYDDASASTDSVTGGYTNQLKTRYVHHGYDRALPEPFAAVLALVRTVEAFAPGLPLDIEFAIDLKGRPLILQVRPLKCAPVPLEVHRALLTEIEAYLSIKLQPHPYLYGTKTVLGVMPDWNPAEIIGVRPRKLARSLYQELITDTIWAYQRDNYGYRNLRSFPLLLSLCGCPYIDVRVSFNSFLPATLSAPLAERLLNHYLQMLQDVPQYHDKVEFEIIFSCYTLDLPQRLERLLDYGFSREDLSEIAAELKALTNRIIHYDKGLWKTDIAKISELAQRWEVIKNSTLDPIARIYWMIEDCKRYGTLPFAGLARAGFIAVQMLKSLVTTGILSQAEYDLFMRSLDTVSSAIQTDFVTMSRWEFLARYGHLRPGTYDILSPRYDEAPELYFSATAADAGDPHAKPKFALSLDQLKAIRQQLQEHGLSLDVLEMFDFIKAAIEGREFAKFMFTRHLSDILVLIGKLAEAQGFSRADASFLDIQVFKQLYHSSLDPQALLAESIESGKALYARTSQMVLPALIADPQDIWHFVLESDSPNFVTLGQALGRVRHLAGDSTDLAEAIVLIENADPGFDWIFSHRIAGLVTMYGGTNSHMAIRAAELGIPAVIGAGPVLYKHWSKARVLDIDCGNKQVRILQ